MKRDLLDEMRRGKRLATTEQLQLILTLSMPAMLSQISTVLMQYIDASMVGRLGAVGSASIGMVSTATWLFNSVGQAAIIGNTVQVAQSIGAQQEEKARRQMIQAFLLVGGIGAFLAACAAAISGGLPRWLGGGPDVCIGASQYFLIYSLALPIHLLGQLASGMLQASGNMKTPGLLNVMMCILDVFFNFLLIFPGSTFLGIQVPGAGLGVRGAALGTGLAEALTAFILMFCLFVRSPLMHLRKGEKFRFDPVSLRRCAEIGGPLGFQEVFRCGAQMLFTRIVAPLGTVAIAAHSLAVTAESLCYMPGYGISHAAATLIGQSYGAGRQKLTRKLGVLTTVFGMAVMAVTGVLMYFGAGIMIGILSPDTQVVSLGAKVLRLEAFAEPMFAASIVAEGVFRGTGDTLVPSTYTLFSMWCVRIPAAAYLSSRMGLTGVWIAMVIELNVRGLLHLLRLKGNRWIRKSQTLTEE